VHLIQLKSISKRQVRGDDGMLGQIFYKPGGEERFQVSFRVNPDQLAGGLQVSEDDVHQAALACTIRTYDAGDLSSFCFQVDAAEDELFSYIQLNIVNLEDHNTVLKASHIIKKFSSS